MPASLLLQPAGNLITSVSGPDLQASQGSSSSELLEPDVFHLGDEDAISRVAGGADLSRSRALELVDRCPSGAISIVELGS